MTDGKVTSGSSEHSILSKIVDRSITNAFIGFGILGALYPFHTWSPDGHASAPTAVSMLHAGVLMKMGGYGALRVAVYLLPEGAKEWGLFFMALTTVNILYGAFGAIRQKDLKSHAKSAK